MSDHREGCRWHGHPLRHQIRPTTACCKEPAHLHECWAKSPSDPEAWCICDELRACEKRVQKIAYAQGLGAGSDEHRQHEAGFVKGYAAALDTAREAVAVIRGKWVFGPRIYKHEALTAIDALREKQ